MESKKCFEDKKVRLFYSVRFIDQSISNKDVETSLPELSGILPEF